LVGKNLLNLRRSLLNLALLPESTKWSTVGAQP